MLRKFLLVGLTLLLAEGQAFAGIILTLRDLGDGGGGYSYGYAINEQGHATGTTTVQGRPDSRAFYWNGSNMSIIDNSPVLGSGFGFDINNSNQIVGTVNSQAFRWSQANGMVLIDPSNFGSANGINAGNEIVGQREVTPGQNNTIFWSAGGSSVNPYPNVTSAGAAINDLSQFVGSKSGSAFYSAGPNAPLLDIPLTRATDINASRLITGDVGGIAALYDFDSNSLTTIGKLDSSDLFSIALGINSHGTAVGTSGGTRALFTTARWVCRMRPRCCGTTTSVGPSLPWKTSTIKAR